MLLGLAQAVVALAAIYYVAPRVWSQTAYRADEPDPDSLSRLQRWRLYAWFTMVFIGLWVIGFHASGSLLSWLPETWGAVDDDGDWLAIGPGIQRITGFAFAGFLLERAHVISELAALRPLERNFTVSLITALTKAPYGDQTADAYRRTLLANARGSLQPPAARREGQGERAYRERLAKSLSDAD